MGFFNSKNHKSQTNCFNKNRLVTGYLGATSKEFSLQNNGHDQCGGIEAKGAVLSRRDDLAEFYTFAFVATL